jgi:deoxyadenosine/deoxycytidine kinase
LSFNGYIAIEGPIGVGKTALAEMIADQFNGHVVRELAEDNPFLADFYRDARKAAFQTQIFFLMSRYSQQQHLVHRDLFSGAIVSDYLFAKDRIFAHLNLNDRELMLYNRVVSALETDLVKPDLVVYLTASVDTLADRIRKRGRDFEKSIERRYLEMLCESYSDYFFHYSETPLLVVKTDNIDFGKDRGNFNYLIDRILSGPKGTEYISFDRLTIEGN